MGTCFGGLRSASVVGKARFLACSLLLSGLLFCVSFLQVVAHTKISRSFVVPVKCIVYMVENIGIPLFQACRKKTYM